MKKKDKWILKAIIANTLLIIIIVVITKTIIIPLNHPKYRDRDFKIEKYRSLIDKDNDGIDDQTDIIQNARKYIKTRPEYKSKYYDTGYPNDNYGVCTDVVAFSLKDAGYDLMELVYEDITNNRDAYDIEIPDKNIDFRRVKNLKVWFSRNAISLTTDPKKIKEWFGGDIVIFENHIGIVSNYRTKKGIPLVIHHYSTLQISYEEDILLKRDDIVGHYRMS